MENNEKTNDIEIVSWGEEKEPKKTFKVNKKAAIAAGVVLAVILVVYFGVAMYYSERFLPGTTVNGENCAGKTVQDIETTMQDKVEAYVLSLEEKNNVTEQIKGIDIGIQYSGAGQIKDAFDKQNSFAWPVAIFKENAIEASIDFVYDETKLNEVITNLECLKAENQEAPVSAALVYSEGQFVIQEETYGSTIDLEKLNQAIIDSIGKMQEKLNLEEAECYILPTYTKESKEVLAAKDVLNKCLETQITYSLDSIVVTLDKTQIHEWISVDKDMNLVIDEAAVHAFANSLGDKYNTQPRGQYITTPTGKVANVANSAKGRIVGTAAECEQLIGEIKEGKVVTRKPVIAQEATPEGQYSWGTTYIEVDLSTQHMWYISNGSVAFETDVVTGKPSTSTPAGVYQILEKKRNKTLVGNIMPETGKPEYETPVDYWLRVTWSGIGFHDATWQPAFGGQLYKEGYGSHGCINMPLGAVATFYDMVSIGCPVVIHY